MVNISEINEKDLCCGCTACKAICPRNAIEMVQDEKGFLYPQVDYSLCIKCGLCMKVCDFKKFAPTELAPISYAVKNRSEYEVKTSRSGAVFMAICDYVLANKGYVFGCEQENKFSVVHNAYNDKDGITRFKGSKYVQSDLGNTFTECLNLLKRNVMVAFSGTPCQVHGLLSFLRSTNVDTSKLITIDLVCHGVPSIEVWKNYLKVYEQRNSVEVMNVNFREKEMNGWRPHFESFTLINGRIINQINNWANVFYQHVMFRESCYNCKYTTPNRLTDFTIADCWGVENVAPEFDDNKGVSLLMVRTQKAKDIFAEIKHTIYYQEISLEAVMQPQLIRPVERGRGYKKFWQVYVKNHQKCIQKYFFPSNFSKKIVRLRGRISYYYGRVVCKLHIGLRRDEQ